MEDLRAALEFAGAHLLQRLQIIMPRMMMVRSSGILFSRVFCDAGVPPPIQHLRVLAKYFRAEIKEGRLRMPAPDAQAHAFVGALSHYVFCETLFGYRPASPAAYIRAVVDTILRASTPASAGRAPGNHRRDRTHGAAAAKRRKNGHD